MVDALNWMVRMLTENETKMASVERMKQYQQIDSEAPLRNAHYDPPEDAWPTNVRVTEILLL